MMRSNSGMSNKRRKNLKLDVDRANQMGQQQQQQQ